MVIHGYCYFHNTWSSRILFNQTSNHHFQYGFLYYANTGLSDSMCKTTWKWSGPRSIWRPVITGKLCHNSISFPRYPFTRLFPKGHFPRDLSQGTFPKGPFPNDLSQMTFPKWTFPRNLSKGPKNSQGTLSQRRFLTNIKRNYIKENPWHGTNDPKVFIYSTFFILRELLFKNYQGASSKRNFPIALRGTFHSKNSTKKLYIFNR